MLQYEMWASETILRCLLGVKVPDSSSAEDLVHNLSTHTNKRNCSKGWTLEPEGGLEVSRMVAEAYKLLLAVELLPVK